MTPNNNERIIITARSRAIIDTPPSVEAEEEINERELFRDICQAIREGGYNPVSQIVGYLVSEDPTHITNYKSARTLMGKLDRDELLSEMVKAYIDLIEAEAVSKDGDE